MKRITAFFAAAVVAATLFAGMAAADGCSCGGSGMVRYEHWGYGQYGYGFLHYDCYWYATGVTSHGC